MQCEVNMTKKNILTLLLDSIFVIAFNVLFFVNGGTDHVATVWICYGFLHFSYLMILLTPVIEAKGKTAYLSKLSTYSISLLYFLIELVLAIIVFSSKIDKLKVVVSVQTVITAIYTILLLTNLLANDASAKKQERHDIENDFIKTISSKVKYIETITSDSNLKNKINNLYYSIHSSPSKSSVDVAIYESKITDLLDELETVVVSDKVRAFEKITEIEQILNKRNFILKSKR